MAIDSYVAFQKYGGTLLDAESQVDMSNNNEALADEIKDWAKQGKLFEVEDYSFDIEQVLNIGSQSTGAGAGKVTFNPFSITRKIDKSSPTMFDMCCSGTAFQRVVLALRKSTGQTGGKDLVSGQVFLRFDFKLVAVKTISWAHDDEAPKETTTFEYGGLIVQYHQQQAGGKFVDASPVPGGWNRVANKQDHMPKALIGS